MSRKTPGEVRARTCGTKSPSRSEALRFIDSSKSPSTKIDGSLVNFRRRLSNRHGRPRRMLIWTFEGARTSPGVFSRHGAPRPLSWTFFQCTLLSYPGQPSYSHRMLNVQSPASLVANWMASRRTTRLRCGLEPRRHIMLDLSKANDSFVPSHITVSLYECACLSEIRSASRFKKWVAAGPAPPVHEKIKGTWLLRIVQNGVSVW